MEPLSLEIDERNDSPSLAMAILVTSIMGIFAYFLSKTTMTILDFHAVTEVNNIVEEGLEEDGLEEEGLEENGLEEDGLEEEELEEDGLEEEELEQEDSKEFPVEDIDDMPPLDDMPGLIDEFSPLIVTIERPTDLSGNLLPWTPRLVEESLVDKQIAELKVELTNCAKVEAVDLLCDQMHQLMQNKNIEDVTAIVAEMRAQMATFTTKDSLVNLTQEVSSLKAQVAQMITDMTALMDRMNLVDSLTIEKDVVQAWFGKASVTDYKTSNGDLIDANLSIRITYSKSMSVADNKSWLSSVMKDDREAHRDGLVGYTDESPWSFDMGKQKGVKRYHTNEWSGNTVDVHVEIHLTKGNQNGNVQGRLLAAILTSLYQDKKITWERQLLGL